MNTNKKTLTLRNLTLATFTTLTALITLAGVGCSRNAANDAVSIVPPTAGQQEQNNPDEAPKAEFKVWKELSGNYSLIQYNGQSVENRHSKIELSMTDFYESTDKKYLDSVIFPLYASVSSGSDVAYQFGPIEGKGSSTLTVGQGVQVYNYKYDGPITFKGVDIEMHLDLNVIKEANNLYVTYTLTVPGHIATATRNFTLQKN